MADPPTHLGMPVLINDPGHAISHQLDEILRTVSPGMRQYVMSLEEAYQQKILLPNPRRLATSLVGGDNLPDICAIRLRSLPNMKTMQAQLPHHDQLGELSFFSTAFLTIAVRPPVLNTVISQPVADHISEVLDKIRADTLCIACWEVR